MTARDMLEAFYRAEVQNDRCLERVKVQALVEIAEALGRIATPPVMDSFGAPVAPRQDQQHYPAGTDE